MGRTFRLIKYKKPYENTAEYPSVAQLDNATDSDSGEWVRSYGTEATMPVYKASVEIMQSIRKIAKEVFLS